MLRNSALLACLSILIAGPALADRAEDRESIEELEWRYARALDTWIEFIGDTHAIHHSYWMTMRKASEGQPAGVAAVGVGADELVKVDGEWLIQVRNVQADQ